jgi:putative ABC transport system substrate-binding protein
VSASRSADRTNSFRQGLRELGYVEGKNLAIEYRWADGIVERLPSRAAELVALNVNAIVVSGGSAAIAAARNATRNIPIIFSGSTDPVASGFVANLARPGGNLTGVTIGGPELYGKRVELMKQSVPAASRVGFLFNPLIPAAKLLLSETAASAAAIGVQVDLLEVRSADDFQGAFAAASTAKSSALYNVIVTAAGGMTPAAKEATNTIPVVMAQDNILPPTGLSPIWRGLAGTSRDFPTLPRR